MTNLAPPNNSLALASLILGILVSGIGLLMGITGYALDPLRVAIFLLVVSVPSLLAIIFGFIGVSTANRLAGKRRTHAIVGIILGFTPLGLLILGAYVRSMIEQLG